MGAGGVNRAAIASSIAASLATLAICLIHGSSVRNSIVGNWVAFELPRSPLHRWAVSLAAAPPAETHQPYATTPPSFLASPRYEAICSSSEFQQQTCTVETYNVSSLAATQPCTPQSLRPWGGAGSWFKDADGHFKYEPSHCKLRRLNAQQARQCLNHKRLSFVGDSLTRYQYLSLAHFLALGVWPERYGGNPEFGQSICIEAEFDHDWAAFYNYSSALLSNARGARSFESCNCRREDYTELRKFSLHSFAVTNSRAAGHLALDMTMVARDYQELKPLTRAIQGFARQPSLHDGGAVIYNVGLWHYDANFTFLNTILNEAPKQLPRLLPTDAPQLRLFWKSITTDARPKNDARFGKGDKEVRRRLVPPWELLDVRAITAQAKAQSLNLIWDPVHFLPVVYEEFNTVLLNVLCNDRNEFEMTVPAFEWHNRTKP